MSYQTGPRAGQQIAAARQQTEREGLAEDLARWAGQEAEDAHDKWVASRPGERHYTHCCDHARESAARDMYAFALDLPLAALRNRHASEREERAVERARREDLF